MPNHEKYAENQKNYPTIVREQGMLLTDQDVIKENRARRAKTVTARTGIFADVSDADIQQAGEHLLGNEAAIRAIVKSDYTLG